MEDGGGDDAEKRAITQRSYAASAPRYALYTDRYENFPGLREALAEFERRLLPGHPILEVGCGTGRDARELAACGNSVLALDLEPAMFAAWRSRGTGALERVVADMASPPVRPGSLGGIWACASLLHQTRDTLPEVVEGLVELLAPGGVLAASLRSRGGADGALEEWGEIEGQRTQIIVVPGVFRALLSDVGLEDIGCQPSGQDWYTAWGVKRGR